MPGIRKWLLVIPLGLALTAGPAMAQRGHGGGPHPGAMHVGGVRPAGVYHGGYYGAHPYYGNYYYHDHHHNGYYAAIGIGLGFGLGVPYYGYYGSPYLGGAVYPYDYGPYGVGSYPLIPVYPATPAIPPAAPGNVELIGPPAGAAPASAATDKPASATVSVVVPSGAELWFDGKQQPAGSSKFVSDPIPPGQTKTLEVQAKWGGSTRSMRIPLKAGDTMTVDLTRP